MGREGGDEVDGDEHFAAFLRGARRIGDGPPEDHQRPFRIGDVRRRGRAPVWRRRQGGQHLGGAGLCSGGRQMEGAGRRRGPPGDPARVEVRRQHVRGELLELRRGHLLARTIQRGEQLEGHRGALEAFAGRLGPIGSELAEACLMGAAFREPGAQAGSERGEDAACGNHHDPLVIASLHGPHRVDDGDSVGPAPPPVCPGYANRSLGRCSGRAAPVGRCAGSPEPLPRWLLAGEAGAVA